jgi:hypothetical protein
MDEFSVRTWVEARVARADLAPPLTTATQRSEIIRCAQRGASRPTDPRSLVESIGLQPVRTRLPAGAPAVVVDGALLYDGLAPMLVGLSCELLQLAGAAFNFRDCLLLALDLADELTPGEPPSQTRKVRAAQI